LPARIHVGGRAGGAPELAAELPCDEARLRRPHAAGLAQDRRSSCGTGARHSSPVVDNASVWWGLREAGEVRRAADERNRQPVGEQSMRADQAADRRAQQAGGPSEATNWRLCVGSHGICVCRWRLLQRSVAHLLGVRLPTEDYVFARTGFASVVDDFYNTQ
jgi:hypothetical protein